MTNYDFENKKYSEKEIRKYIEEHPERCDQYFWWSISTYQTLSELFIKEFQDKVRWYFISEYQNLSEPFLIEFIDNIDIDYLKENQKIPKKIKNNIINLKKVRNV